MNLCKMIEIKSEREIGLIEAAGKIVKIVLEEIKHIAGMVNTRVLSSLHSPGPKKPKSQHPSLARLQACVERPELHQREARCHFHEQF